MLISLQGAPQADRHPVRLAKINSVDYALALGRNRPAYDAYHGCVSSLVAGAALFSAATAIAVVSSLHGS
jgi:hypothetical protein